MLGKLVRELRGLNISQRELAQKIGVSHSYISKLESALESNVTDELIDKLSLALECDRRIMYVACGKILPETLQIDPNASSIYKEIENYIRSNTPNLKNSPDEISLLFNVFNHSKTITILVNHETYELIYMNISASMFLKRCFVDEKVDSVSPQFIAKMIALYNIPKENSIICTYELKDANSIIDLNLESFKYNETYYLLIQIFEESTLDRFNEFAFFSKKHFNGIFDNSLNAVFVFKYTDHHYDGLIHVNASACHLLNYTEKELLTFDNPTHFELQTATTSIRLKKLIHQKHFHDISVFITKDNRYIPVKIFSHLGSLGKNTFVMLSCEDLNSSSSGKINL